MKAKKYGIIAATTVAVLMTALLITACADPMRVTSPDRNMGRQSEPNNIRRSHPTPAGLGAIRWELHRGSVQNARTVMPALTLPALTGLFFEVIFTPTTTPNGAEAATFPPVGADFFTHTVFLAEDFLIEAGNYIVHVNAFTANNSRDTLIGSGTIGTDLAPIVITASSTGSEAVVINPLFTGHATNPPGTFNWDINVMGSGHDAVTMTITPGQSQVRDGTVFPTTGAPANYVVDLVSDATGNILLPTGFFTVAINATRGTDIARNVTTVLHVFSNLNSDWVFTLPDLNTPTTWAVDFRNITGERDLAATPTPILDNTLLTYAHGALLTAPVTDNAFTPLNPPVHSGAPLVTFGAWHGEMGNPLQAVSPTNWGAAWNVAVNLVRRDTNLYARFVYPAATTAERNITVDWGAFTDPIGTLILNNTISFDRTLLTGDWPDQTFTHAPVVLTSPTDNLTGFQWW